MKVVYTLWQIFRFIFRYSLSHLLYYVSFFSAVIGVNTLR